MCLRRCLGDADECSGHVSQYKDPPENVIDAWAFFQTRIARRPPNTALVNIVNPKEAHQKGVLIIYRIDRVKKSSSYAKKNRRESEAMASI